MTINILLFVVALCAGAINSVAGGGSFLTLPTLLFAGITPVIANATTTLAMWPGSLASAIAYRRELRATPIKWLVLLCAVSVVGGFVGAVLLVLTSDTSFMRLLPWLMLVAAVTFTFGGRLRRTSASPREVHAHGSMIVVAVLQFVLSIYGGYFGGGMSIMMLAAFSVAGMTNIHEMNALKSLLSVGINGIAVATFIVDGTITWAPGLVMVAGGISGGYLGAALARRVAGPAVRTIVIVVAWVLTAYFFLR